jgi:hypothetical protein
MNKKNIPKEEQQKNGDPTAYRVLPTRLIGKIDPFLFLNHHGRQIYASENH